MKDYLPNAAQLSREVLTVIGGALIAAVIVSQIPGLKAYIKAAWQ